MFRCMGCMNEYDESMQNVCPYCGYDRSTKVTESYHLPPETILQGRYIVGKVLGFGGFGVTYIGFDAELERTVAIKEYLPSAFATRLPGDTHISVYQGEATTQYGVGLQRFVEEAQTLAQFNGVKGVVDIYDSFMSNNSAYIIMQFIKGKDVKQILRDEGVLSYERAREIVLSICDTLAPIHAKGIIHRDISPDNIYITDEGEIKLLDFGAARYESSVNSKSLSVILKSGYAPEEQYRSKGEQGSWTDVYALAATFYKMIAGRTPQDSMERAISDELQEPSKFGVDLPVSSENAILNALGVRKQDRTQTVTAFKEALLSDGVERIIAKPVKLEKSGIPLGAKIAMALGIVIFLGLGIFTAMGGFDNTQIIGGTTLEDNYGSVDSSGYATVPDLVGLSYDEAIATLEECGLTWEIESYEFGSPDAEGYVSSQSELAGSQKLLGTTVSYTLNVGSPLQGMEYGWIPNLLEMEYDEALDLLDDYSWSDGYYEEKYTYSTEDEKGHIVDITYEDLYPDDDYDYMCYIIWIGIGPETTNTNDGVLELAWTDNSTIRVIVGSLTTSETDGYTPLILNLYVSTDEGVTWEMLEENMSASSYGYSDTPNIKISSLDVFDSINIYDEKYLETSLQFKVDYVSSSNGNVVDTMEAKGSLFFEYSVEIVVDTMEELTLEEIREAYEVGYFDGFSTNYFEENYYDEGRNTTYWKLTGSFEDYYGYEIFTTSSNGNVNLVNYQVTCRKDGEIYLVWEWTDASYSDEIEFTLAIGYTSWSYTDICGVAEPIFVTLPKSVYLESEEETYYEPGVATETVGNYSYEEMEAKFYELYELYGTDFITELEVISEEFETEEEFWNWLMENY